MVPVDLPDWQGVKGKGYTTRNPVREENDAAFQSAVIGLFNELSSWNSSLRLSIDLIVQGREAGSEPLTDEWDDTGEYRWDFKRGRTKALPVYRARFVEHAVIPDVACINRLQFPDQYEALKDHQIWAGAAMEIVRHCPTLTQLRLNLDEYIRPIIWSISKRGSRATLSDGLRTIPPSLRVFNLSNQDEKPWKPRLPGLNVLSSDMDTLSANLGHLSLSLRHLRLDHVSLAPDFLFPLDNQGHPLASSASLHWPYLEILEFDPAPPRTVPGQWLVHATPEHLAKSHPIDDFVDWERVVCDVEEGYLDRTVLDAKHFNRLLIALGHAARQMPRLRYIKYLLDHGCRFQFIFCTPAGRGSMANDGDAGAKWYCEYDSSYAPDPRVAAAWGCPLVELGAETKILDSIKELTVTIPSWPPA
ncbi:hypothetical protein BJX63DRAFT_440664 [Aspergillus granulosus]|uniref:Uncharacterized protein n=1 Tax=Aspergillus granulosus TaxID=176169 RepID=A0ABR4GVX0_9EURO